MSFSQLANKVVGRKMNADGQAVSGSNNFIPMTVGIVEGRSFSDSCLFLCFRTLRQLRALYKGTGHASRLERAPPDVTVE